MKHILLLIGLLLTLEFSVWAQDSSVDSIFKHANDAYGMQDYTTSIELYQTIVDTGYKSPELFMNMGNAYFKTRQYAKAILYFEKANLLDPGNIDIQFNLQKAQAYNIDRIEVIPEFFLIVWVRNIISIFSSNTWAVISFIALLLCLGFLLLFFIFPVRNRKVIAFSFGVIFLMITILSYSFAGKTKNYIEHSQQAIVMTSTVTVKGSPDSDGVNVFIIHEGTKVFLLRSIGEWHEIKIADGKQGWLQKNDVESI